MTIHAPGLPVHARSAFSLRFKGPRGRKKGVPALSMSSMIDVLVVLLVYLLIFFESPAECGCVSKGVQLPSFSNGLEMIDAPLVTIGASGILLDGSPVEAIDQHSVTRIDGLFTKLKGRHELAKQLQPHKPPPSHVVLAIDGDVPAYLVKSVVHTAAMSGYAQIDFMGTLAR